MISRRGFLIATGAAACKRQEARAREVKRMYRIGRLSPLSAASERAVIEGLREGLRELGWREGENVALEFRFAEGRLDRLPALAAELAQLNLDVIVTGSTPGALAAKHATRTIPVVMVTTGDPVAGGIVESLARPGGNVTGVTSLGQELNAKGLQLLKEAIPTARDIAILANPASPYRDPLVLECEAAAQALRLQLRVLDARSLDDIEAAFRTLEDLPVDALLVPLDPLFISHSKEIANLASQAGVPIVCGDRELLSAGGLLLYGASLPTMYRHAAVYVDRILRGASPADLPVEQPTSFEFLLNLKAARALGIDVPGTVVARADEVIE